MFSDLEAGGVCLGLISMSIRNNLASERNLRSLIAKIRSEARGASRGLVPLSNDLGPSRRETSGVERVFARRSPTLGYPICCHSIAGRLNC